jgi:hypothetical protein
MKRVTITFEAVLGMLATAALLVAAGPAEFDMTRSTIDSGGAMRSTGGEFELSGTIGQPDAGTMLTGGSLELVGGFWFEQASFDCDYDGGVTLFDYDSYQDCVSGPGGDLLDPSCACFDLDSDVDVDLVDFGVLQRQFNGT